LGPEQVLAGAQRGGVHRHELQQKIRKQFEKKRNEHSNELAYI
jgi:hypothetical protein